MPKNAILLILILMGSLLAKPDTGFLPKTFEANYIKEEKAILSGKIIKVEGQIFYQYPGRIRLEETGRNKSVFVSNPFKTYYFKPALFEGVPNELTVNKSSSYPLTRFLDSLRKGLDSNDLYKVTKGSGKIDFKFTKKGLKELKIMAARLVFKSKPNFRYIESVEITLDNKKKVRFVLNQVKVDRKLKKEVFEFKTPKNTRVFK